MKRLHKSGLTAIGIMLFVILAALRFPNTHPQPNISLSPEFESGEDTVWEFLKKLGKAAPNHELKTNIEGASAEKGKELVHTGTTTNANGKKTKKQSKFYPCVACHNTVKEFEDLAELSPEKKLEYAIQNRVPFVQASTFYGIVNRNSFYNGDYQKKYKGVAGFEGANKDLRSAIQFCSQVCSQGRELEAWEVESILVYFWELQLKMKDLKLSDADKSNIESALREEGTKQKAIEVLESKYVTASPAHFTEAPHFEEVSEAVLNDEKRFKSGAAIFELGCMHCHHKERFSFYSLEKTKLTFKHLESATRKHNHVFSMYLMVRDGLPPRMGRLAYMPQYTLEKMSEEQLLNLYIYVKKMSK